MQSEGLFVVDRDIPSVKVRIVNAWLGGVLPLTVVAEEERKEVLRKNPFNSLPFAETGLGVVSSADQIMRLLARKSNKMYGKDSWEAAEVDGWLEYVSRMISLPVREIVQQQSGQRKNNQRKFECAKQMLVGSCEAVDRHLSMRTYLVGDRPTIADISLFVELAAIKQVLLGVSWQHLERWMQHIQSLPVFQSEGVKTQLDQINQSGKPHLSKQQIIQKEQTSPTELPPKEASTEPLPPDTADTQPN